MKARLDHPIHVLPLPTPEGEFIATYNGLGLCGISFPGSKSRPAGMGARARVPARVQRWHKQTAAALARALEGRPPGNLPPLDVSSGTEFQKLVWRAMRGISTGKTMSYGQIARTIGNPEAVRAVGGACGANQIPVFIPCHRVLAANLKIGGFSGGLKWKRLLLEREGVRSL